MTAQVDGRVGGGDLALLNSNMDDFESAAHIASRENVRDRCGLRKADFDAPAIRRQTERFQSAQNWRAAEGVEDALRMKGIGGAVFFENDTHAIAFPLDAIPSARIPSSKAAAASVSLPRRICVLR